MRQKKLIMTFVDFKIADDSVHHGSLINILREFGAVDKALALIKDSPTNTYSGIKFMSELSDVFEIKTGVKQGDVLSPILFNCVLEKVIRKWRKQLIRNDHQNGVRVCCKSTGITSDCLVFTDNVVLLTDNIQAAEKQIEKLQEMADKTGLRISFEKRKYIVSDKNDSSSKIDTLYGTVERTNKFKYLGEILAPMIMKKNHL